MTEALASSEELGQTRKRWPWVLGVLVLLCCLFYYFCGLYTIQPIGALPEGGTAIVWRESDEPFFNSPDGTCLRRIGGVSLMCRGMAMADAPIDRIVMRLPYQEWAYSLSTDGQEFDR